MSAGVVLDAGAAVKLVLDEEHREHAQALYERAIRAGRPVLAPPLLPAEVINAIYRRRRRTGADTLTPEEAREAVDRFLAYPITLVDPAGLYRTAYTLAETFQLPTIYDATYLALAQLLQVELWTADERLLKALGGRDPRVRRLGDFPLP